ncbi:MAG TPA: c-type cytochrome [Gemmatimonadaceae bacterium]|jgi:cytochrome c oxidase cbb3-type subunit 3|nr:c-type cytochrome [Gemmatimonadaceae bacterium]
MRRIISVAAIFLALAACEREARRFNEDPSAPDVVKLSSLQPGPTLVVDKVRGPYDYNAYGISEGKILFNQFNCSGCHAHGGGGMGPPLMDAEWIYGSEPQNIFATIAEGRPGGMPAFRERLSNDQIWRLVSYVRSMSGLLSKDTEPSRDDAMSYRPSEQRTPKTKPKASFVPPASER